MRCGTRRPFGPSFDQGDRQGFVPSPVNLLLTKAFDGTGRNTNNSWTDTAGLSKETRVDVVVSTRSTFARHISCHNRITHTHTHTHTQSVGVQDPPSIHKRRVRRTMKL